ncbi:Uncharacterised protein [Bordetella avium]|nr:Uncharacterised protein [Bordetella avium]
MREVLKFGDHLRSQHKESDNTQDLMFDVPTMASFKVLTCQTSTMGNPS